MLSGTGKGGKVSVKKDAGLKLLGGRCATFFQLYRCRGMIAELLISDGRYSQKLGLQSKNNKFINREALGDKDTYFK
jgi:hypothetical protein